GAVCAVCALLGDIGPEKRAVELLVVAYQFMKFGCLLLGETLAASALDHHQQANKVGRRGIGAQPQGFVAGEVVQMLGDILEALRKPVEVVGEGLREAKVGETVQQCCTRGVVRRFIVKLLELKSKSFGRKLFRRL